MILLEVPYFGKQTDTTANAIYKTRLEVTEAINAILLHAQTHGANHLRLNGYQQHEFRFIEQEVYETRGI